MQANLTDVRTESSGAVVILSMDVIGDRSADGDEASAGSDRKEPSFREKHIDDVGEADSAFAAQHAGGFIEGQQAVQSPAIEEFTPCVETGVAVTASQTVGKQAAGSGTLKNVGYLIAPCGPMDV